MNRFHATTAAVLLLGTSGCVELGAEEPELLVPDDVALRWDTAFNGAGDDLVALVPVDVMVYEAESGEPLESVVIDVIAEDEGTHVVAFDTVLPLDAEDCEGTPCLWDAWRDRYLELAPLAAGPLSTDADGLARLYLMVDAFPVDGADFAPVSVLVSMGITEASFQLVPQ